jgi:hypothetical protein
MWKGCGLIFNSKEIVRVLYLSFQLSRGGGPELLMAENLATNKPSSDRSVQKLNPYFSYHADTKQIQDLAFNRRGIIINERFWNRLRNVLIDLLQD